jgi:hypothetical protein
MGAGYPINWALPNGNVLLHPLYIKYSNTTFENIALATIKTDLNGVLASSESAEIVAYLSWLIRVKNLLA